MAFSGVPRKDAYTTDKIGCWQQTLVFMPEWATFVPQMPKTTQVLEARVLKHSEYLALWLRKSFSKKTPQKDWRNRESVAKNVTVVPNKTEESPGMTSVTNVKGLLQITEVFLQSSFRTEKVLVLSDSACSNSWICANLARKLDMQGALLKFTVHGINSHQTSDTQIVKLKLTPVHSGGSCPSFVVQP